MRFSKNSIGGTLRMGGLAAVLSLGAGLTGCDSDDNGGGDIGAADISTPAGARAQVGNFVQILGAMDAVDGLSDGVRPSSQGGVNVAATDSCPNGGSVSDTGPTTKSVASPYTQKQMSVSGITYNACKTNGSSGGGTTTAVTIDGASEGGSVDDGGYAVSYTRVGESLSNPLSFVYDIKVDQQGTKLDTRMTLGIHLRDDYREGSADEEGEFLFNIDGNYSVSGTAQGQAIPATTGDFRYYFGKDGAPFRTGHDSQGLTVEGEYGFTLSGALSAVPCAGGAVTVSTEEKLVEGSGQSPFSAGKLKLSAGGSSATVTFNNNNSVTIAVGGSSQTVQYSELLAESATCAGLGLAGLYMASGLSN